MTFDLADNGNLIKLHKQGRDEGKAHQDGFEKDLFMNSEVRALSGQI
jgi:hypothetical protein